MSLWRYIFITRSGTRTNFKSPIPIRLTMPIAKYSQAQDHPRVLDRNILRHLGEFSSVETIGFRNIGLCVHCERETIFGAKDVYARTTTPTMRPVKLGHPDRRRGLNGLDDVNGRAGEPKCKNRQSFEPSARSLSADTKKHFHRKTPGFEKNDENAKTDEL